MQQAYDNLTDILTASGLFVVQEKTQDTPPADSEFTFPPAFYDYFQLDTA